MQAARWRRSVNMGLKAMPIRWIDPKADEWLAVLSHILTESLFVGHLAAPIGCNRVSDEMPGEVSSNR